MEGRDTYSTVPPSIGDTRGYSLGMAASLASWPTPDRGMGVSDKNWEARKRACQERYGGDGFGMTLGMASQLAHWPTPMAPTGGETGPSRETGTHTQSLQHTAKMAGEGMVLLAHWPTPKTPSGGPETAEEKQRRGRTKSGGGDLAAVAQTAGWATPAARDYRWPNARPYAERGGGAKGEQLQNQAYHLLAPGTAQPRCPAGTEDSAPFRGRLNPCLPRWLQGLPLPWDLCAMEIPKSSPRSRKAPPTAGRGSADTATPSVPPRPQSS